MAASFFFYDLETTGFNPRRARIMQFAGQRTDLELNPIGEPINYLIKLTADVLPDPEAILLTGITPQKTLEEGYSEAEFLKLFYQQVVTPGTTFIGFNSIRFDDEFMRFLNYRNFYDAYEWQWKNGCSRWDLLDVVRMTRALRPDGLNWPYDSKGKPVNRLERLAKDNNLLHEAAHDALSDVQATVALAKLIRDSHSELFDYLYKIRDKKQVASLVKAANPLVYTSGRYGGANFNTSVAVLLTPHATQDAALVYDLRHDPTPWLDKSVDQLVEAWRYDPDAQAPRLPVKTLKYNHCPALAPLGVMKDKASQERINLSLDTVAKHLKILKAHQAEFVTKVLAAVSKLDEERDNKPKNRAGDSSSVDERLYESFFNDQDRRLMTQVRSKEPKDLTNSGDEFDDPRLQQLLPLYRARNYPKTLSASEREVWDKYCYEQLVEGGQHSRLNNFFARLNDIASSDKALSSRDEFILEELKLYGESLLSIPL